eukprot:scaffold923_cov256-Pinguiococcus_pyrenoidosus.AAC.62
MERKRTRRALDFPLGPPHRRAIDVESIDDLDDLESIDDLEDLDDLLKELIQPGHHGSAVVHEAGGDEGVVEDLLGHQLRDLRVLILELHQADDDLVLGVELQSLRREGDGLPRPLLVNKAHHLLERPRLLVGCDDGRGRLQPVRGFDLTDLPLQGRRLEPVTNLLYFLLAQPSPWLVPAVLLRLPVLFLGSGLVRVFEVQVGGVRGDELSRVVLVEVGQHDVVDVVVQEEDLPVALAEGLEVRRLLRQISGRREEVVDILLLGRASSDVVVQADELPGLPLGRLEEQKLAQLLSVDEVADDALLDEDRVLLPELSVFLRILLLDAREVPNDPLGQHLANLRHEPAVLRLLTRHRQGQVFAVDHAAEEPQPVGHDVLAAVLDEDLPRVDADALLHAAHPELLRVVARHEEDGLDVDGRVGAEVQPLHRRVEGAGDVPVEVRVLLLRDVLLRLRPQGLHGVHLLAVHRDGVVHEVGVAPDDVFHAGLLRKLLGVLLELHGDFAAALHRRIAFLPGQLLHGKRALTGGPPQLRRLGRIRGLRLHRHLFGHHEGRVEADAELADDVLRRVGTVLRSADEVLGAGASDSAQVELQLLRRHADPRVLKDQGVVGVVHVDLDLQRQIRLRDGIASILTMLQLLQSVRSVAHELSEEDFTVRVERVRHDIQQLLGLRLKVEALRRCGQPPARHEGPRSGAAPQRHCVALERRETHADRQLARRSKDRDEATDAAVVASAPPK